MPQTVKIKSIENRIHHVLRIVTQKPAGLVFKAGQAIDLADLGISNEFIVQETF